MKAVDCTLEALALGKIGIVGGGENAGAIAAHDGLGKAVVDVEGHD